MRHSFRMLDKVRLLEQELYEKVHIYGLVLVFNGLSLTKRACIMHLRIHIDLTCLDTESEQ